MKWNYNPFISDVTYWQPLAMSDGSGRSIDTIGLANSCAACPCTSSTKLRESGLTSENPVTLILG